MRYDDRSFQAKRIARSIAVPTNDLLVQKRLRSLTEPIILFGEQVGARMLGLCSPHLSIGLAFVSVAPILCSFRTAAGPP